jgi:hypothetical protein
MGSRRETLSFGLVLAICLAGFFHDTLVGDRILSPADVLLVEASFRNQASGQYEPINRLLMDPVLQFQPWLEFNRTMLRQGRLPLWNPHAGCGAPHLANGQSAVFDPFHLLAYIGTVPRSLAWMAALRLWIAGLGMFLLARSWKSGVWGRWFAGLVYPFCGFLTVWLLYPVTPVAIWLPWLLLATDRTVRQPQPRSMGLLGLTVGLAILGGHIQTTAHVLLATGLFALWRIATKFSSGVDRSRRLLAWGAGIILGLLLAAVQILPLGYYLAKSQVWGDRQHVKSAWWMLDRPRLLDAVCTAFPYAYGSQRRGHPNLARALGVHNLNESAGGYAGLATLIWLAPLALAGRRRNPEVIFLAVLGTTGALAAFRLPPVDNLLRALPVLDVTDNRRLSLWVAFSLCLLGGFGMDSLARGATPPRWWIAAWLVGALAMGTIAVSSGRLEPLLRDRAERHYRQTTGVAGGTDSALSRSRAEHQVQAAVEFIPRYYGLAAGELLLLASLALAARGRPPLAHRLPPALLVLTLAELAQFGLGLNPAIENAVQSFEPPVISRLRARLKPGERALGIGEELPPNVLMRFGLGDPRNYDSVELARSRDWLAPLFEPEAVLTSRSQITWDGVHRASERLEEACVAAVVASTPPSEGRFRQVERVGDVWIAWLDHLDWSGAEYSGAVISTRREAGAAALSVRAPAPFRLVVRESWDPSWRAWIDGSPAPLCLHRQAFMALQVPAGEHKIRLSYNPREVMLGLLGSGLGLVCVILALTGLPRYLIPGITKTGLGRTQSPWLESGL